MQGCWMKDYIYFSDLTHGLFNRLCEESISEKGRKEGVNLFRANHGRNVAFKIFLTASNMANKSQRQTLSLRLSQFEICEILSG